MSPHMAHRVGSRQCGNTAGVGGEARHAKDIAQPTRMTPEQTSWGPRSIKMRSRPVHRALDDIPPALALAIAVLLSGPITAAPLLAADSAACRELDQRYEIIKADITSVQLNLALFSATDKGCEPLVRRLLAAGASVLTRDRIGAMPLARAARWGQLALVDLFLAEGAPIDARSVAGSTALYTAAEHDRLAIVRRLIDRGANPNLPGRAGVTPLSAASYKGNVLIVEYLLARGANPNAMDATGKAPILYAAGLGFASIVRLLLDSGVDVNARYGNDLTALMWAAGYSEGAGAFDAKEVVNLLIERGAAIDAADDRGRTALMIAAEAGHATIVDLLLRCGADRDRKDKQGRTALDLSTEAGVREKLAQQDGLRPTKPDELLQPR
jgi:ankyrin repeat protein